MIPLSQYSLALNPVQTVHFRELEIAGVSNHSGKIGKNYIFCAVRGASRDGRAYIADALKAGACAVVSDDPELELPENIPHLVVKNAAHAWGLLCQIEAGNPARRLHLHAITGTNGKTTTAYLLRKLISEGTGERCGLISTIKYDTGMDSPEESAARTTPDAKEFQRILNDMVRMKCTHAVMEASSHGLHQKRMGNALCDTAVFSNLTGDHLDYHHDMESYFQAKRTLFTEHLSPNGHAVINIDDPWGKRLAEELGEKAVTFSLKGKADCMAENIRMSPEGSSFLLNFRNIRLNLETTLIGLHNISNLTSAVLAALLLGIKPERIAEILKSPFSVPGRLEPFSLPNGAMVYVDYAHTDDALERVLTALRPLCRNHLTAVFGCGGDRDRTKRPRMAEVCGRLADLTVITSDNPRTEDPLAIIDEVKQGMPSGKEFRIEPDRAKAIQQAISLSSPGDIILIAGKGHETYQEINGVRTSFDDREVVRSCGGIQAEMREQSPITKRILEMGTKIPLVPTDWDYRNELSETLSEKYGVK